MASPPGEVNYHAANSTPATPPGTNYLHTEPRRASVRYRPVNVERADMDVYADVTHCGLGSRRHPTRLQPRLVPLMVLMLLMSLASPSAATIGPEDHSDPVGDRIDDVLADAWPLSQSADYDEFGKAGGREQADADFDYLRNGAEWYWSGQTKVANLPDGTSVSRYNSHNHGETLHINHHQRKKIKVRY